MRQQLGGTSLASHSEPAPSRRALQFTIIFEYTGQTSLTVVGPVSGWQYRFAYPGAQLAIDPRDRPGLSHVPQLRQLT
jgi:hypothetical protein